MIHAADGTTALQLFQNHQEIDLILMDLRLPDINGFDLVRKIKSVRKDIVIIAQTASVTEEDRLRSFKVGCSDFISKPIAREKLIEVLRKYLD
jgi:CheY-like chemotaxis protein